MLHSFSSRDKKSRYKQQEDWQWYEDPYKTETKHGQLDGSVSSHAGTIPAPNPRYGTEPPVHTGFRAFA